MKAKQIIDTLEIEISKENINISLVTELIGKLKDITGVCKECKSDFFKIRYDQVFCSEKCSNRNRQRAFRERKLEILKNQGISCQQ